MTLSIGDAAPPFRACNPVDKSLVSNADFVGKTVVLAFFPAAFSGSPDEGCEMQLCGLNSLVESAPADTVFYGVSGDLPFANEAFGKKLNLNYPLLSDPTLASCERYVGICDFGAFLNKVGITDALDDTKTTNRGCVIVKDGKISFSFSGEGHPGNMPSLVNIRNTLECGTELMH